MMEPWGIYILGSVSTFVWLGIYHVRRCARYDKKTDMPAVWLLSAFWPIVAPILLVIVTKGLAESGVKRLARTHRIPEVRDRNILELEEKTGVGEDE